jgi:hypothetical protein
MPLLKGEVQILRNLYMHLYYMYSLIGVYKAGDSMLGAFLHKETI